MIEKEEGMNNRLLFKLYRIVGSYNRKSFFKTYKLSFKGPFISSVNPRSQGSFVQQRRTVTTS